MKQNHSGEVAFQKGGDALTGRGRSAPGLGLLGAPGRWGSADCSGCAVCEKQRGEKGGNPPPKKTTHQRTDRESNNRETDNGKVLAAAGSEEPSGERAAGGGGRCPPPHYGGEHWGPAMGGFGEGGGKQANPLPGGMV